MGMTSESAYESMLALKTQVILKDTDIDFLYNYYRETGYLLYFTTFCSPLAAVNYLEHTIDGKPDGKCLNRGCRISDITDMLKANHYVADFVFSRDTENRGTIETVAVGERLVCGVKREDFRDVYFEYLWRFHLMLDKAGFYIPCICWEILPNILRSFLEYKFTQLYRLEKGVDAVVHFALDGVEGSAVKIKMVTAPKDIAEDFDLAMYTMFNTMYQRGMLSELCEFVDERLYFDREKFMNTELTPTECLGIWIEPARLSAAINAVERAVVWLNNLGFDMKGGVYDVAVSCVDR